MTPHAFEASSTPDAHSRTGSLSLRSAALISLLMALALAALAFWPSRAFTPPRRPTIAAPVVFDEFVNPVNAQPKSAAHTPSAIPR